MPKEPGAWRFASLTTSALTSAWSDHVAAPVKAGGDTMMPVQTRVKSKHQTQRRRPLPTERGRRLRQPSTTPSNKRVVEPRNRPRMTGKEAQPSSDGLPCQLLSGQACVPNPCLTVCVHAHGRCLPSNQQPYSFTDTRHQFRRLFGGQPERLEWLPEIDH